MGDGLCATGRERPIRAINGRNLFKPLSDETNNSLETRKTPFYFQLWLSYGAARRGNGL